MTSQQRLLSAYLVNATLVLCHEIDAAYWHEWRLFHLPGGPAGFVAIHFVVVPLVLAGLVAVARGSVQSRWWAIGIGGAGIAGCIAHLAFLLHGDERFSTPFSVALIIAFGLSSLALAVTAINAPPPRMEEKGPQ